MNMVWMSLRLEVDILFVFGLDYLRWREPGDFPFKKGYGRSDVDGPPCSCAQLARAHLRPARLRRARVSPSSSLSSATCMPSHTSSSESSSPSSRE